MTAVCGRAKNVLARLAAAALLALCARPARAGESPTPAPAATAEAPAALPHELDLGEGLTFFRARTLPADLPPAALKPGPLVLDLRYATAADSAATALDAWLKFRATPKTPVFVLLNLATAPALRAILAASEKRPAVVTLGPTAEGLAPDLAIDATDDEDRAAYDALEHGATPAALIAENADKPRSDEAALARERSGAPADPATTTEAGDPASAFAEKPPAPPPPPPVIDFTLQRAVHLHRALVALKRL